MMARGGEFSTGTMGNFQPELTFRQFCTVVAGFSEDLFPISSSTRGKEICCADDGTKIILAVNSRQRVEKLRVKVICSSPYREAPGNLEVNPSTEAPSKLIHVSVGLMGCIPRLTCEPRGTNKSVGADAQSVPAVQVECRARHVIQDVRVMTGISDVSLSRIPEITI
jgi:hypothetical protein